jgi:hypothetical protein
MYKVMENVIYISIKYIQWMTPTNKQKFSILSTLCTYSCSIAVLKLIKTLIDGKEKFSKLLL